MATTDWIQAIYNAAVLFIGYIVAYPALGITLQKGLVRRALARRQDAFFITVQVFQSNTGALSHT
jgi:hypothetical protein